ncbi:MAG: PQQ-like beta-propeller repeat protein [Rhodospirillales bacterium]|nr:PQQ-like beta-propeller repeat protein [Rhodospirillales bacterium]
MHFPGGLADSLKRRAYVRGVGGTVEALNLPEGRLLWQGPAAEPLALAQGMLVAAILDAGLRLTALDSENGQPRTPPVAVPLPDWVETQAAPPAFAVTASPAEDGAVLLRWQAQARMPYGTPPPPHLAAEAHREAAGILRFDPSSGRIDAIPSPSPRDEDGATAARGLHPYRDAGLWRHRPWVAGDGLAALTLSEAGESGFILWLRLWRPGESGHQVELRRGQALVAELGCGGGTVFVHDEALPGKPWSLHDAATGHPLAEISLEPGAEDPCLLDETVYVAVTAATPQAGELPRHLAALSLDGRILWRHPLHSRPWHPPPPLPQGIVP